MPEAVDLADLSATHRPSFPRRIGTDPDLTRREKKRKKSELTA
jgi:hypothetical protein